MFYCVSHMDVCMAGTQKTYVSVYVCLDVRSVRGVCVCVRGSFHRVLVIRNFMNKFCMNFAERVALLQRKFMSILVNKKTNYVCTIMFVFLYYMLPCVKLFVSFLVGIYLTKVN